ncbi:MAG: MarR family winged helix-turn-helix transcriptional regulator [Vicinamibacteria bacterium]
MQGEIRQTKPFASPEQEGFLALLRTTDLARRRFAGVVEPHGITGQQYNVLRILMGSGPPGLPTLEIADRMIEQAPGITRLLDRLEAKGLVERVRCPRDRRRVLVHITRQGMRLLSELRSAVEATHREALGGLGRSDLMELIRLLDAVRAGQSRKHPSHSKALKQRRTPA